MALDLGEPGSDHLTADDLFTTISEAHYLPELAGPHDEALLDSLVEKGCEDNQILGQALDKLASLATGEYGEEEDDILLGGAPVSDIIDRLEHELGSPERSNMSAAQGLLNLHQLGERPVPEPPSTDAYTTECIVTDGSDSFEREPPEDCNLEPLNPSPAREDEAQVEEVAFEERVPEKSPCEAITEKEPVAFTEVLPEKPEGFDENPVKVEVDSLPDQSDSAMPVETNENDNSIVQDNKTMIDEQPGTEKCNIIDANAELDDPDFDKNMVEPNTEELGPTDLSIKHTETIQQNNIMETTNNMIEDNLSDRSDEQPKDLSVHKRLPTPHASPRRIDIPRAPSRESDAMQSPQPSGIPAIPSSPELFTVPQTKSKQTLFLETLLSSPSPKMYTSEVTITKQQCEPLNLGKHRKSASPTVSSCSDEIRKMNKEFCEPQEKRTRRESSDDLARISKVFMKNGEEQPDPKMKKPERSHKTTEETSPIKQLQILKTSPDFNIPDPLLVPKDKLNDILAAPGREIPALLIQRPELRLPEAFAYPSILQDPDILVISLSQLENIIENDSKLKSIESRNNKNSVAKNSETQSNKPDQTSQHKSQPSVDGLAGDIDAATSAALNQMLWLPYLSQLEAAMACSQNMDFLKALHTSGYSGNNYPPELSQMFNPSSRFMGHSNFSMMPSMEYDNRLQFAMWQEAMNQANASRSKASVDAMKELAAKSDVQNPYVHSTKNQSKTHSSARTSPIAHNYNNPCQRTMAHPLMHGMYPNMNQRQNMPLPNLQIPYFNPCMMGQRSPRTPQQKSPTSPYYQNNNYLQSAKHHESQSQQRSSSASSQESPRPRISVKSLSNLLDPAAVAASGVNSSRRSSNSSNPPIAQMGRRREDSEVVSTTAMEEPPAHPTNPHDPIHHLWHPLFGNQKGYTSPWSWTTVTATGD